MWQKIGNNAIKLIADNNLEWKKCSSNWSRQT